MTEAEIMEQINQKRTALEQIRSSKAADAVQVQTLEEEIKKLESSLTGQEQPKKRRRSAFLDECAG
jgi:hypothetical protein